MFSFFSFHLNRYSYSYSVLLRYDGPDHTILVKLLPMHLSWDFVSLDKIFYVNCNCLVDFKQHIEQEARKVNWKK